MDLVLYKQGCNFFRIKEMADVEKKATPRAPTAAEKRAARRARVLQGSESRLKLLKGQIASLKEPQSSVERRLDEGVDELLATDAGDEVSPAGDVEADSAAATDPAGLNIPTRVDPVQRRRDAAARRRKKEAMVQEMIGNTRATPATASEPTASSDMSARAPMVGRVMAHEKPTVPAFSRHSLALKLHGMEEKLVLLLIVGAAVYLALSIDLRAITASLAADDQLFVSYQDLITKGVPMDSIRQQFEREQLEPEVREKLERLFAEQLKSEALGASAAAASSSSWLPDVADLAFFFSSLLAHPPIVLCVFLVRLLVSTSAKGLHVALDLPSVKSPQEDDLGFVANLALSSRPALKGEHDVAGLMGTGIRLTVYCMARSPPTDRSMITPEFTRKLVRLACSSPSLDLMLRRVLPVHRAAMLRAARSLSSSSARSSASAYAPTDAFLHRHLGVSSTADREAMLATIGYPSVDALVTATVPAEIRLREPLALPPALSE
ncbi:hypothetical protein BBJ28_00023804, partial [Nothophytophthora sp. Chile5]